MKASRSLVQAALDHPAQRRLPFTTDELDLIEAWLTGRIGHTQVAAALKKDGRQNASSIYLFLARGARELWGQKR